MLILLPRRDLFCFAPYRLVQGFAEPAVLGLRNCSREGSVSQGLFYYSYTNLEMSYSAKIKMSWWNYDKAIYFFRLLLGFPFNP